MSKIIMFAVVEIGGVQTEVTKNGLYKVPLLGGKIGESVEFNNILMSGEGSIVNLGNPYIQGTVTAKITGHGKDEKVLVFHKKRRKGYRKLNGHRQRFTTIEVTDIKL